jgi:apolipoprotein N-acyltransferase
MLTFGPQLWFLWTIFGPAAFVLWLILAFWIGLFVALARLCGIQFGPRLAVVVIPIVWMGVEYFRSELYYLRFSWLNVGYAFSTNCPPAFSLLGVYGVGFVLMLLATGLSVLPVRTAAICGTVSLVVLSLLANFPAALPLKSEKSAAPLRVAGIQMEFPVPAEVESALNRLIQQYPEAELLVLSEYTFDGPVPQRIKAWCQRHRRYLIVGGKEPVSNSQFHNTAFVIGPDGEVVFRQAKCVPIQFFKDGLPAPEQKVWDSPWGKLGICICYDLSYTRVVDRLVRLGAETIIVPTMDVADWGGHQHRLHARVAPVRSAEYGVPIFRVCSSGISQLIDRAGDVIASAPFPGELATISGNLRLAARVTLPADRVIAPLSTLLTALFVCWILISEVRKKLARKLIPRSTKMQRALVPL